MRPTVRPWAPMNIEQAKAHIYDHFVIEKNPRCVIGSADSNACIYGQTGCAVGCCFTQEDADLIDKLAMEYVLHHSFVSQIYFGLKALYIKYFEDTPEMLEFLKYAQNLHDRDFRNIAEIKNYPNGVVA